MKICKIYTVSGRVQGVWFRAGTQKIARKMGITGWAKNLPDRSVQVLACGDSDSMKKFEEWLKKGPAFAKVKTISSEEIPPQEFLDFETR